MVNRLDFALDNCQDLGLSPLCSSLNLLSLLNQCLGNGSILKASSVNLNIETSAHHCRPRNAKRLMKYKYAVSPSEKAALSEEKQAFVDARPYLQLNEWGAAFVEADPEQIGFPGSPTKVKNVENVVFTAKDARRIEGKDDAALEDLIKELITNHTIG